VCVCVCVFSKEEEEYLFQKVFYLSIVYFYRLEMIIQELYFFTNNVVTFGSSLVFQMCVNHFLLVNRRLYDSAHYNYI
jgi:hypothetical protein